MSEAPTFGKQCVLLLCTAEPEQVRQAMSERLSEAGGPLLSVETVTGAEELRETLQVLEERSVPIPLIVMDDALEGGRGDDILLEIHENPRYRATRKLLLSRHSSLEDLTRLLNRGALNTRLKKPAENEELAEAVRKLVTDYFLEQAPGEVEHLSEYFDPRQLSHALVASERLRRDLAAQLRTLKRSFLSVTDLSDECLEEEMIREIDRVLDRPPRETTPAGTVMFREGEPVDKIWIIIEGKVRLSRMAQDKEVVMHMESAGKIVGLLALAQRQTAFYTCRTATELTALPITLEQLDLALQASADLSVYFDTVLIRTLATRVRRSAELQVEVENLNTALSKERDQLAETLDLLQRTQSRLLETEKMATLGLLSAGIAHELNNPISAILRSAEYFAEDLEAIHRLVEGGEQLTERLRAARQLKALPTREERRFRERLGKELNDMALARRLVGIGVYKREEYEALFRGLPAGAREERLKLLERVHKLGTGLRNIHSAAERVTNIVKSLRSYARPDEFSPAFEEIHEGLEDTLLLFGPGLKNVRVERRYGKLPKVECLAAQLNQVWTNLISNSLEAMGGKGTLTIETEAASDGQHVHVRIIDSGPGIPKEVQERIFGLHFTTKQGRVQFGLGMGLSICQRIVNRHGGSIELDSRPGRTCFTVTLPVRYPGESRKKLQRPGTPAQDQQESKHGEAS